MQPSGGYLAIPGEGVLYAPAEYERARKRPVGERTPIPAVGDELLYRHREGSPNVYRIEVIEVQDPEDYSDANLWYFQTDANGQQVFVEGRPVLAQAHDPWPWVIFRLREPTSIAEDGLPFGLRMQAREARMRGATGWLPLNYRERPQSEVASVLIVRH